MNIVFILLALAWAVFGVNDYIDAGFSKLFYIDVSLSVICFVLSLASCREG